MPEVKRKFTGFTLCACSFRILDFWILVRLVWESRDNIRPGILRRKEEKHRNEPAEVERCTGVI